MRLRWIIWAWPFCILLFTVAVTLITFMFPDIGARPAVIMAFLFVIPGMAVVRFFRIEDIAIELMLAIALSFAIDAFTAGIILYAGQWSPKNILSFLIGFCFSGAVAQLAIVRPTRTLVHPLAIWNVEEEEGSDVIIDLAKAPSSRQKAEKTRAIIELATSLSKKNEDADITLELPKIPSPRLQNEDTETTIILKHRQINKDTEAQTALFHQFQQAQQDDAEEKTISLDSSELSSKKI